MVDALSHRPKYSVTNESLLAIMGGLQLTQGDDVLAIAGSGDQGFAMLELANKVVLIDDCEKQIEWVRRRARCLARGDAAEFLYAPPSIDFWQDICKPGRDEYFEDPGRIERIRANLSRLKIKRGEVSALSKVFPPNRFNKIYLSNSEEPFYASNTPRWEFIAKFISILAPGGLIYHSDIGLSRDYIAGRTGLVLERELTQLAIEEEEKCKKDFFFWKPGVFRKAI